MNTETRPMTGMLATALLTLIVAACGAAAPLTPATTPSIPPATPGAVPALSSTFTSAIYDYSIKYPGTYETRAASAPLQGAAAPLIDSDLVDQLNAPDGAVVVLGSGAVQPGTTLDEWTASTALGFCGTAIASEAVHVSGEAGTLTTFASCAGLFHQWVTVVHDGRGYHIVWANDRGTEAADKATFLAMVASFKFQTAPSPS